MQFRCFNLRPPPSPLAGRGRVRGEREVEYVKTTE